MADANELPYLTGADYMKSGLLVGVLEVGVVVSLGYVILFGLGL